MTTIQYLAIIGYIFFAQFVSKTIATILSGVFFFSALFLTIIDYAKVLK